MKVDKATGNAICVECNPHTKKVRWSTNEDS